MGRRTKDEALETRRQILEAALDLFSSQGYSQTTFVDVARRIGMTKGAVYWHFRDKPTLLAALIVEMRRREDALVAQQVPEVACLEDMKRYFTAYSRVIVEDDRCRKFAFFIALQMEWSLETLGAVREHLTTLQAWPFDLVAQLLTQAQAAGELRPDIDLDRWKDIFAGTWRGLILSYLAGLSAADVLETVECAFDVLIESVRAR